MVQIIKSLHQLVNEHNVSSVCSEFYTFITCTSMICWFLSVCQCVLWTFPGEFVLNVIYGNLPMTEETKGIQWCNSRLAKKLSACPRIGLIITHLCCPHCGCYGRPFCRYRHCRHERVSALSPVLGLLSLGIWGRPLFSMLTVNVRRIWAIRWFSWYSISLKKNSSRRLMWGLVSNFEDSVIPIRSGSFTFKLRYTCQWQRHERHMSVVMFRSNSCIMRSSTPI